GPRICRSTRKIAYFYQPDLELPSCQPQILPATNPIFPVIRIGYRSQEIRSSRDLSVIRNFKENFDEKTDDLPARPDLHHEPGCVRATGHDGTTRQDRCLCPAQDPEGHREDRR